MSASIVATDFNPLKTFFESFCFVELIMKKKTENITEIGY